MPKLISGYIRGQIAKYLGPQVLEATLIDMTPGTRNPVAVSAGTNPTPISYPCNGFTKGMERQVAGTIVKESDRRIVLLGGTLPEGIIPEPGDKITIDSGTYRIIGGSDQGEGVDFDADKALFKCHGRKMPG